MKRANFNLFMPIANICGGLFLTNPFLNQPHGQGEQHAKDDGGDHVEPDGFELVAGLGIQDEEADTVNDARDKGLKDVFLHFNTDSSVTKITIFAQK